MCGLQRRISLAITSLAQRIEALECGNENWASQDRVYTLPWTIQKEGCRDAIGRFDALEATVKDLQDRVDLCNCNILPQTSSQDLVQELLMQDGGHAFPRVDAFDVCLETDPSHVMCLEALKEKWDEIQADDAEMLERIGSGASVVTVLQVGNTDSESSSSSDTMFGSAAFKVSHKATRYLVSPHCRDAQQAILDSGPRRVDACDGDTRTATAVRAESVEGIASQDTHLRRRSTGQVNQVVVTSAKPVTPLIPNHSGLPLPRHRKTRTEGP